MLAKAVLYRQGKSLPILNPPLERALQERWRSGAAAGFLTARDIRGTRGGSDEVRSPAGYCDAILELGDVDNYLCGRERRVVAAGGGWLANEITPDRSSGTES